VIFKNYNEKRSDLMINYATCYDFEKNKKIGYDKVAWFISGKKKDIILFFKWNLGVYETCVQKVIAKGDQEYTWVSLNLWKGMIISLPGTNQAPLLRKMFETKFYRFHGWYFSNALWDNCLVSFWLPFNYIAISNTIHSSQTSFLSSWHTAFYS